MSPVSTLVLTITPRAAAPGAYWVQLAHEGKPLAVEPADLDLPALLALEHSFDARAYGLALYQALFTGKVNEAYQRLIGQAGSAATLRIQLVIADEAGELHALAWERLFHPLGDTVVPLATSAQTPFSRFLISGSGDQAAAPADPLRFLLVVAYPHNLTGFAPIAVAAEVRALVSGLAQAPRPIRGTVLPGRSGLPAELRQELQAAGWTIAEGVSSWRAIQQLLPGQHIVHLLAHGQWAADRQAPTQTTAYLLLEREDPDPARHGALEAVDEQTIVAQLSGVHPLPQLFFLAACESARRPEQRANPFVGLAPKLVAKGIPAVIAMQDTVESALVQTLAHAFYLRLLEHGLVDQALNEARALVYARQEFGWAIPVLFLRLQGGRLFAPPEAAPRRQRLQPPPPPPTYAERTQEESTLRGWLTGSNGPPAAPVQMAAPVRSAIQGIGGQGKSVLARKVAQDCAAAFPGGVLWIDVGPSAPNPDPAAPNLYLEAQQATILNRVARELGLDLSAIPALADRTARLREQLGTHGRLLAVLDDLWDPDVGRWLLDALLPPDHAALLTTRQLDLARALADSQVIRLEGLTDDEALTMLANLLGPLNGQRETARQIGQLLEGLALALELGARRCDEGVADLPWLLDQLQRKPTLGVLTLPGQASRATSLEYTLSLSLQGLDETLVARFCALGAFAPTPFDLPALAAVWAEEDLDIVETQARQLVQRALLQRGEARLASDAERTEPIYVQHSLLQTYALALATRNQTATAHAQRHAAYYAALPKASWSQAELYWPQIEQAWRWTDQRSLDERMAFLYAVEEVAQLRGLWESLLTHGQALLTALQGDAGRAGNQAYILNLFGLVYDALGEMPQALAYYNQALPLRRQVGDKRGEANTLNNLGAVYQSLGEMAQALAYYNQALPLIRQVGDKRGESATLNNLGAVYRRLGKMPQALAYYNQALPLIRQVGDKRGESATLNNLGAVYQSLGEMAQALAYYNQALSLRREVGDKGGEACTLNNLGEVYRRLGEMAQALAYYNQALPLIHQVGDKRGEAATLNNLAVIAYQEGDFVRAAESFEQILRITEQIGAVADTANVLLNLAIVLHRQLGRTAEAIAHLTRSVALLQEKQLPRDASGCTLADHQAFLAQLTNQAAASPRAVNAATTGAGGQAKAQGVVQRVWQALRGGRRG